MSEVLGLDVGKVKTGVARASSLAALAEPMMTIPTEDVPTSLKKLTKDHDVEAVVVGLPRNLDGDDTDQTRWVRHWAANLKAQLPDLTFYWQDEALTSKQAAEKVDKNITEDAAAAAIMLQDYLEADQASRVVV